ncbi:MAG: homoserine kinase [Lachnospiraceae bacterium]|nr:homoserine kinase [Candidatus Minthocola equi]
MIISVPATSANIGPGFDCLGIAWQLYNEIEFSESDVVSVSGCDARYCNENNLAYKAYAYAFESAGKIPAPVSINFGKCDVPVSRGLGSSATLTVAGIFAANEIGKLGLSKDDAVRLATQLEGHPDNVVPAVYGGFTAAKLFKGNVSYEKFGFSDAWKCFIIVPDFEVRTQDARAVLPASYPKEDVIYSLSRIPLLISALAKGDGENLADVIDDKIHEPYRRPLICGYDTVRRIVEDAGADGFCISGSGSSMLCFARTDEACSGSKENILKAFSGWKIIPVSPDKKGAQIIY